MNGVDRISFKFLWNKKWDGKCPDRIQRQLLKNSYELGGLKATDMAALNSALKVKQFINAAKYMLDNRLHSSKGYKISTN